jgi:hypothetical protein
MTLIKVFLKLFVPAPHYVYEDRLQANMHYKKPEPGLGIDKLVQATCVLEQTIQLVRAECVRQRNEVAIKLGIIFLSLSLLLSPPVIC